MFSVRSKGNIEKNGFISNSTGTASVSTPAFINTSHKITVHRHIQNPVKDLR